MKHNRLFLLVGPSGTGKTSILEELVKRDLLVAAVSHSTRPMRLGEEQGKPYFFVKLTEFEALDEAGVFVEQVVYNGNRYGFSAAEIETALDKGNVGLIVEGHGAEQLNRLFPGRTRIIFMMPPPIHELRRRMADRGNTPEEVEERLQLMIGEMRYLRLAEWQIETDRPLQDVIEDIVRTIQTAR